MAETTAPPAPVISDEKVNVIEDMLNNLKLDVEARDEQILIKEEAADFISDANERIRNATQALGFMTDYMTEKQIAEVEELDLFYVDQEEVQERSRLNEVAQQSFDLLSNSKTGQMTNGELYERYTETVPDNEQPLKYGEFNIKLRSLFSNMRLLREIPEDVSSSRDHIIKVNGFKGAKK